MRSLLDDLRESPTPLALTSRTSVVRAIKDAHVVLLRAALAIDDDTSRPKRGQLANSLRRYALWLEDAALDADEDAALDADEADEMAQAEMSSILNLAATLFEFAGRLDNATPERRTIFAPPLNDFLHAALVGSLTDYQAQPAYLARRIDERLRTLTASSPIEQAHDVVARVIASFLGRRFNETVTLAAQLNPLMDSVRNDILDRDAVNQDIYQVDRALALGLTCRRAAAGMLTGTSHLVATAARNFERVVDAARQSGDIQRYWLARRLKRAADRMHDASMHRVLADAGIVTSYRTALARDGILELWRPQREAIAAGLLRRGEPSNFVVSLPTGGGKTLIAELAILDALRSVEPTWALYITPSRSLAHQVSGDLRRHLNDSGITVRTVVAGAEQAVLLNEELDVLAQRRSVTVTTPEKCDAYYRNAKDLFGTCALVIFDEVHKIGDKDRGALLESLITRFVIQQRHTRLLLLSGSLSNHEELRGWLGEDRTVSIIADRRPTRQLRGVIVRTKLTRSEARTTRGGETRRVDFRAGAVLVHEQEDLDVARIVSIPDLFEGHYTEKARGTQWQEDGKGAHSTMNDHAVSVASVLSRAAGTTLVFVQQTQWAEGCCERFEYGGGGEYDDERAELASFLADQLGSDHQLVRHCRRGVAYHHARLPNGVQRAIELGLQRGWLKVVFATSTLREGLNMAVTNVVLAGDTYFAEGSMLPIAEADFEQMAGRAGRPFNETEGRVILVPTSLAQAKAIQAGKRYMLIGDNALRVRSQMRTLIDWLERSNDELETMPEAEQSLLLTLVAAGLTDGDDIASFFTQSLWGVQQETDARVDTAIATCTRLFARARETVGTERLNLAARTGFSLTSIQRLHASLTPHIGRFIDDDQPQATVTKDMLAILLEAALQVREIRKGELKDKEDVPWAAHLDPIFDWITACSYRHIARTAHERGVLATADDVGGAVKYCADISTWLSWGFGACYTVLASIDERVRPIVGMLPLLVKYGVSSLAAAYISLLGLSDRGIAELLGKAFEETGRPVTLDEVAAWTTELGQRLNQYFPRDDLRNTLVEQVFGVHRRPLPYMLASAIVEQPLMSGQFFSLRQDENGNIVVIDQRNSIVALIKANVATVLDFVDGSLNSIVGFAPASVSLDDRTARIIIMRRS
jgi:hypothetical protein